MIYISDLQRALETAEIISKRQELPIQIDKGLSEVNQGEWEGLLVTDVQRRYPHDWATRESDPLNARAKWRVGIRSRIASSRGGR